MPRVIRKWLIELFFYIFYKTILEVVFLKDYMKIFGYMFSGVRYECSFDKWIIGTVILIVLSLLVMNNKSCKNYIYSNFLRVMMYICIIPMLSVYAFFSSIELSNIIYPSIFYVILIVSLKMYGYKNFDDVEELIKLPAIKNADIFLLMLCGVIALAIWAISGFPVILGFDSAYEQRMSLRLESLPSLLNYLFMFIGGTVFPYLFAKKMSTGKYIMAGISLCFGIIMFFVNGMKTWLFLYPIFLLIMIVLKEKDNINERFDYVIHSMFVLLVVICVVLYERTGIFDLMSQFARVTIIPNNIGFKSVDFFKQNELLYLRESILRFIWTTPYKGGSDFFINYGTNSSITSSRANNGLWGDAFRNFGIVGIIVYPFLIAKVFNIIETNSRNQKLSMRFFVLFLVLWSSINTSFFTWLLTGGVIIIAIMEKIDRENQGLEYVQYIRNVKED